jgi:phosphoribosylamine---glycine ligase
MKILVVGRGGREHAIAWKIAQSKKVTELYVAPGNDGMNSQYLGVPINETDVDGLVEFVKKQQIDLTIVGPESALMEGIVDQFQQNNLKIFGPTQKAAMIEGSKEFAKDLMTKYHIPTADYKTFTDYEKAVAYLDQKGAPIVVKYDGLAAGKGVVVAMTYEEALTALQDMLLHSKFGEGKVILEEFLDGPEFSLMALVNGEKVIPLAIAQDHKRAYDGDQGPNTGGMGAYSSVPIIPEEMIQLAVETIMNPTAQAMVSEGTPFTGVLYGGLILTKDGPKVIEFNARFGDPETEVVLPKMKSDLVDVILDLLDGKVDEIEWFDNYFLGVVLASKGYPNSFEKGIEIKGLDQIKSTVFHMGTSLKEGKWVNNGGRVLFVVGEGNTLQEAQNKAYEVIANISSEALFFRKDIGWQAIKGKEKC